MAGRYASALFALAQEQGATDQVAADLARFSGLMAESADLTNLVRSPVFTAEEQVKALMLLGTPIDFHRSGILASFTKPDVFDADLLVDALGNVPPAMLQAAFKAMAPSTLMHKFWDLSDRAEDADAVIHYAAVERWLEDNISFPGGLYRPYIKGLYQENGLVKGTMKVGDRTVDLKKLAMPVLNIIGLKDNIVNVDGSRGLMPFLAQGKELAFDTGHIGLTTSKRAHRELWPQAHAWALEHA